MENRQESKTKDTVYFSKLKKHYDWKFEKKSAPELPGNKVSKLNSSNVNLDNFCLVSVEHYDQ